MQSQGGEKLKPLSLQERGLERGFPEAADLSYKLQTGNNLLILNISFS